ncbi:hypothetical protein D9619_011320 [Psilocybe cf. subviscida]|uniref:PLAC8-domain-containing protein n=1 Tax=Psilocybe cf. subviscida TaxID=2480587 RepID=A0A8H5BL77_9AGAR|nr:hypothetical protein D9619_011320 [Psilocybe cf. subviscida]
MASNGRTYQSQPTPTAAMVVAPGGGGNRNAKNLPVDQDGREYSHGLCAFTGRCETCIVATICPCWIHAKNKKRYMHLTEQGTPDPQHGGKFFSGACCFTGVFAMCGLDFICRMGTRGDIRKRYNIKGGAVSDCCVSMCCGPCQLTQDLRELELEENSFSTQRY